MNTSEPRTPAVSALPKGRVEAFSDGVFAVAITLLVLDITLTHHAGSGQLWAELWELKYHYAAYAISFLTIGIMWVSHHHLMTRLATVDHALLYLNLALLAVICFIPFPTSVLSEYVHGEGGSNMRAAVTLYGITLTALSVAFLALWVHIYRSPNIRATGVTQSTVRVDTLRAGISFILDVIATALAPVAPWVSLGIFITLVIVYALARPRAQQLEDTTHI